MTIALLPRNVAQRAAPLRLALVRLYATETSVSSPQPQSDLPPPVPPQLKTAKPRLYPRPRRVESHRVAHNLPKLPPSFGKNQLLPVSNDTRALLESIVSNFDAPIRYAFAYGSGVFEQDGYAAAAGKSSAEPPMVDFMFAVTHADHFHSINMAQHPGHYPLHARLLGSSYVSRIEALGPGVWFNAYIPMNGVVRLMVSRLSANVLSDLCSFLLHPYLTDYQIRRHYC